MDTGASGSTEWLRTDGAGGFAMGPVGGPPERRYHAWMIAALEPPLRRTVLVRWAAEWVEHADGRRTDLSCFRFAGPEGDVLVGPRSRDTDHPDATSVRWTTSTEAGICERLLRLDGAGLRVQWSLRDAVPGDRLVIRPFTPLTPFHELDHRDVDVPPTIDPGASAGAVRIERGEIALVMNVAGDGGWRSAPEWWERFVLRHERDRGQDAITDAWSPGVIEAPVASDGTVRVDLTAALEDVGRGHRSAGPPDSPVRASSSALDRAAEAYVVRRGDGRTIIAGYPWFADWGRDAMISLPGLLPPGERDEEALSVLVALAAHRRDGLLPNCFHDESGANDHAADTGPWFLRTSVRYAAVPDGVARLSAAGVFDACADIVDAVVRGTRWGIRLDEDGLVTAGRPGDPPVTWMDAMRGGVSFTPRHGKAVEINALWIEGLAGLVEHDPDPGRVARYRGLLDRARSSFPRAFRWRERGCLVDRVARRVEEDAASPVDRPVHELRPNQLLAAACPHVPLTRDERAGIVAACEAELLTPVGLRTLAPSDPAYVGQYRGDLMQRDAAYHQGTVWPWLLGPWVEACLLAAAAEERATVARTLRPILEQGILRTLDDGCAGQLAEIFGGDAPHPADGCPAQAWSVAEVRRAMRLLDAVGH